MFHAAFTLFLFAGFLVVPVSAQDPASYDDEIVDSTIRYERPEPDPVVPPEATASVDSQAERRKDSLRVAMADDRYRHGRMMAWTGLTLTLLSPWILGAAGDFPLVGFVAAGAPVAFILGVPMMAAASAEMDRMARRYPQYSESGGAMGWYTGGLALEAAAGGSLLYIFLSNMEAGFLFHVPIFYSDVDGSDLLLPAGLLFAGVGCQLYSMRKSRLRREAAFKVLPGAWTLAPELRLDRNGGLRPGTRLAYRF